MPIEPIDVFRNLTFPYLLDLLLMIIITITITQSLEVIWKILQEKGVVNEQASTKKRVAQTSISNSWNN